MTVKKFNVGAYMFGKGVLPMSPISVVSLESENILSVKNFYNSRLSDEFHMSNSNCKLNFQFILVASITKCSAPRQTFDQDETSITILLIV